MFSLLNQLIICPVSFLLLIRYVHRVLPWWDPLVVHWPVGQTGFTGEDPVIVLPSGAKLGFTQSPQTTKFPG